MKLFNNTFSTVENALNYSSLKQRVIADNIANVDTPNYKAQDVSFGAMLNSSMNQAFSAKMTDQRHIPFQSVSDNPAIITQQNVEYNDNGNSVDIDKEMSNLATNQIYYSALTDRINGMFSTLQTVIKGGK
ncbi:flagellar biosynthesis protein FlgB [Heyndrickxia shackletonii]|uniref:Flagellar basal body rod protein FlgB n=1 Tax=Heyndrickxia shackletonii TaxID=157838 RepID=A0A0Q3X070_9BACI|nr:flagellar basal body rod protein FlgB [Heyndrickxia shackletonii]KQL54637.1 flagellar biosynthesis protein FlgB [Heyndrickxia shackletonii]NEY98286.1 flagellar basal body rod protein FlgB [Heyndrickxia shackletonii]